MRTTFDTASHVLPRIVDTPKQSSWLNQIELVYGIVHQRAIQRGRFRALDALKQRLLNFIDYLNRTFAHPFRWTYTGRHGNAQAAPQLRTCREQWTPFRENRQELARVS